MKEQDVKDITEVSAIVGAEVRRCLGHLGVALCKTNFEIETERVSRQSDVETSLQIAQIHSQADVHIAKLSAASTALAHLLDDSPLFKAAEAFLIENFKLS